MQDFDFKNQIYLNFFLLKHTKGSREAAFDDLCILATHAPLICYICAQVCVG